MADGERSRMARPRGGSGRSKGNALTRFARSLVSQKKRRYKDSEYDLDLSYITENVIAMGFPAGDRSSGVLGYVEGLYRNHMGHVTSFLDEKHPGGKYKIYNLCSERTYDAALFDGKVASFPFDDHNCPPLRLIQAFVESAKSWLRQSMSHVVVVHCKAGKSRTGLMICCLLIYLSYADTAEEAVAYYNLRRTHDGKGLTLASQQRYLRYYELLLKSPGEVGGAGRRLRLASLKLHHTAPHLYPAVYVSDHSAEKLVFSSEMLSGNSRSKWKQIDAVEAEFVLPFPVQVEEDFKVKLKDKAGEYYLWLNTRYIKGNQVVLEARELDRYKYRHKSGLNWNLLVELNFSDVVVDASS
ncbi:tensin phosphatase [Chloropicon primus]|uniref:Tensin phosphatase n=1 Tax=Chloropicon primus TaxID=1764295 RepID=A0A5B8MN68_9CHLO|nr:tensin phosphatase [Chloropicon primus]UPR00266.1 tensin phosphatase [Chloropicon primus]|eukprot:QDZ21055.1 tensin phosphatase [Chloropicon primus]